MKNIVDGRPSLFSLKGYHSAFIDSTQSFLNICGIQHDNTVGCHMMYCCCYDCCC